MNKLCAKDYTMNIRENPTTDSKIVGLLSKGQELPFLGFTKEEDYTWIKVPMGYIAYLDGVYLHLDDLSEDIGKKEQIKHWLDESLESTKQGIAQLKELIGE